MDAAQQQIVESIKSNSNILVTVSTNPSVDELSAALGLTLLLDKMDKRATAIFSGNIPPAISFLEPNKTFENSADSLRDFIIALDKEKADHLRYKVEGDVVKIFITPYKTTLSEKDLEFSQGDYNVELVVALGVKDQDHLDKSLDAHGKILHDAKVMTITAGPDASSLGNADWHDNTASSLSEMIVTMADQLKETDSLLDEQVATALLTGIVSATDRFSNDHTSSRAMTMAAQLMAAGANQQLIAAKLEEAHDIAPVAASGTPRTSSADSDVASDGTELVIERNDNKPEAKAETGEKVIEPPQGETPEPQTSKEDADQAELEKQLGGMTSPTGTLEDIEKDLQQAVDESAADNDQLTAPQDASMPGFEPTDVPPASNTDTPADVTPPEAAPVEPAPTDVVPAEAAPVDAVPPAPDATPPPEIINDHGPANVSSPEDTSPINSIQTNDEANATVDPFNVPATAHEGTAVVPTPPGGTPEGVDILMASPESSEPAPVEAPALPPEPTLAPAPEELAASPVDMPPPPVPPALPVEQPPEVPELPSLPPLPPLPSDANMPPLPPPPPPPVFGGQDGAMPSGAVSGDVFGDGASAPPPPPTPPAAPPAEPGQFRIPGQ